MARKQVPISTEFPYHVSARCLNREWFGVEPITLWTIFEDSLFFVNHAYDIRIHSFVLMSNHFHLLCSTPSGNLSAAMQYFMTQTSKQIAGCSGRINHVYGARFHRTLIASNHYFEHAYKYVYRNPSEAGITSKVENYPWSTLSGILGHTKIIIPVEEDTILFPDPSDCLKWLNQEYRPGDKEVIAAALKRRNFVLPKTWSHGKGTPHRLETAKL